MGPMPLSELIETFLRWASQRLAPKTVTLYRHYLYQFRNHCGNKNVSEIKRLDIEIFSVKRHPLEIVRRFFRWCVEVAEVLVKSPTQGVSVPRAGRRSRVLSRRECVSLRRRARRPFRDLLLALEETGARPIEIRLAEWGNIRTCSGEVWDVACLKRGECYIELEHFKGQTRRKSSGAKRIIPISPRLGRLLGRILPAELDVGQRIFRSPQGRFFTANALRMCFRRLIPDRRVGASGEKGAIVPYTYRHTAATMLAHQGTNVRLLADFLGHSSVELLAWYVHPSTSDLCELLRKDPRKGRGRP